MVFICKKNCGECCGPVPFEIDIWEKHKHKIKEKIFTEVINGKVIPIVIQCPFLDSNKQCIIYEDRPDVCKQYGLVDDLLCPYIKPNGNKRTEVKTKQMLRQFENKLNKFCLM
jgi:Fe-S-cluster containining protein